jgi:hypothetical protein
MANRSRDNTNNKEAHVKGPKKEHNRDNLATNLRGSCTQQAYGGVARKQQAYMGAGSCKEAASLWGSCEEKVVPEGTPWGAMETDPQKPLDRTPLIPTAEAVEGGHGSEVITATPIFQIDEVDQDYQYCSEPAPSEAKVY